MNTSQAEWDKRFIQLAYCVRSWSKDPKSVGAVVADSSHHILGIGYNGFPTGIADTEERLLDKEAKRKRMIHAEVNALLNSKGQDLQGSSLYITRFPCAPCSLIIIQMGVKRVVSPRPDFDHPYWGETLNEAFENFKEAGIEVVERA